MKYLKLIALLLCSTVIYAQNKSNIKAEILEDCRTIKVEQILTFTNTSINPLIKIHLTDWNYAYATKKSAVAKRFSDEFNRSFHLSKKNDKAQTIISNLSINNQDITFKRLENQPDIIEIELNKPLPPNEILKIDLIYELKIPNSKYTKYGYYNKNKLFLKNCFLNICDFEKDNFLHQSDENLDDFSNLKTEIQLELKTTLPFEIYSDLNYSKVNENNYLLTGSSSSGFSIILDNKKGYENFQFGFINAISNIDSKNLNEFNKVLIVERIANFSKERLGILNSSNILVTQENYDKDPFYGLNELPNFITPFNDDFLFELKFLKTYLNEYVKKSFYTNIRKNHWLLDAYQYYLIKDYIDTYYPDIKAFGKLSNLKILKAYKAINMNFTEQFLYNYLLTARKNLDQPMGLEKNKLIKFNTRIASPYQAGLLFEMLSNQIGKEKFDLLLKNFIVQNSNKKIDADIFLKYLEINNIDTRWIKNIVYKNKTLDFKFKNITSSKDSVSFEIRSNLDEAIPFNYNIYKDKELIKNVKDTIQLAKKYTFNKQDFDRIIINEVDFIPEIKLNNNSLKSKNRFWGNKPYRMVFFKDLENPKFNQTFFVPEVQYNYYDGLIIGMNFNNKSIIDVPLVYDVTPTFSTKTSTLSGNAGFSYNQLYRDSKLYSIRYSIGGTRLHYAPDAFYSKITPSVSFRFRNEDLRENEGETVLLRQVYVNREQSKIVKNSTQPNYSVFNLRYTYGRSELVEQLGYTTDFQLGNSFSKISSTFGYRKLFENNRFISFRVFGGIFLKNDNKNNDFFSFGLDRPSDYLFDYSLLGRNENSGLLSQQYIYAEGGFKSKLDQRFANQYIFTANTTFNIWNWIEVYADFGTLKSKNLNSKWVYDTGLHLNLVQDYFELFLPVYSSNGYQLNSPNYGEKIRFVITLSPKVLTSLVTRRWF